MAEAIRLRDSARPKVGVGATGSTPRTSGPWSWASSSSSLDKAVFRSSVGLVTFIHFIATCADAICGHGTACQLGYRTFPHDVVKDDVNASIGHRYNTSVHAVKDPQRHRTGPRTPEDRTVHHREVPAVGGRVGQAPRGRSSAVAHLL
jgi:hypothetical protein